MRADADVPSMQVYDVSRATGETRCPLIHQAAVEQVKSTHLRLCPLYVQAPLRQFPCLGLETVVRLEPGTGGIGCVSLRRLLLIRR